MSVEVTLRIYNPKTDEAFIYATWTQQKWYSNKKNRKKRSIDREWLTQECKEIKNILLCSHVWIACFKEDPGFILGYIVIDNGRLQFMYVKQNYRGSGVEDLLLTQIRGEQDEQKLRETH